MAAQQPQATPTQSPLAPSSGLTMSMDTASIKQPTDSIWNHIDKKTGTWRTTGFNPRHLDAARKKLPYADPWARNEAWRYQGVWSRYNRLVKGTFPGIGIGFGAFVAYSVYEAVFTKDEHHGESEHH